LKALKQDLLIHDLCHEIALERLEESDVAEYLSTQFPESQFPEGLAKLVYRHSGGNALFMVGIVQDMVKKGLIAHTHARWTLTTPLDEVDTGAPETLQQMIQVQFEQLSESEQSVLKSACVAGESFSVWAVTTTLEMQASRIEDVCEGLAERQQFIKAAGIHELANGEFSAYYEFRHSLYREILYRRLSDVSRSKLHRLLGERLKALCTPEKQEISAELALHFEESHEYEQAIQYLLFTAENAAKRFALRGSVEVLQHALELVPRIPPGVRVELELRILGRIGDVHYALGNMPAAAEVYKREAIGAASAGLPEVEVNALSGLARAAAFSDGDRGMAACEQAVEVSMRHNDPLLLARAQMLAASFRLLYDGWRREDAELCASADRTLRLHSEAALPAYYWMMYSHIQSLQGDYQGALESDEVGTSKTVETASLMVYLAALSGKVFALVHLGRFGDVLRIVQSGEEMSKKNGNDPWLSIFRSLEVWLRTLAFDFEGALRVSRMVLDKDTGQVAPRLKVLLHTGFAQLELANYDEALQCFQKLLSQEIAPKDFLHWYWRMSAQLGLSNVWLASGITAKAHHEADIFLASALATADPNMQALAWEMKARVAIAEKDFVSAQECVGKAETILEKFEIPCSAWRVHATAYHLFTSTRNDREAERHRSRAEACVLALANSFSQDEPLRATFLAAEPVRRILNKTVNDRVRERRSSSAPR
jgi:tetratricopeptide (TPR) repeat protein